MIKIEKKNKKIEEKLYKNKEWLENQINFLGKTQIQVARECGVTTRTIFNWLKENRKEDAKEYRENNKEKIKKYRKKYNKNHKEEIKEWQKEYKKNNKEEIKEYHKEYYLENKEELQKQHKEYNETHKKEIKEYNNIHKDEKKEYKKNYYKERKIQTFNNLGGCKCAICGNKELSHLTIDHIDETGYLDKKMGYTNYKLYSEIILKTYPQEKLSNLRVLCFNCNCGRRKEYLNIPSEKQTKDQRYRTKLWKKAYDFFGPCKTCGDSNLVHLTISHIHNDGAERKRNGEPNSGLKLFANFRKQGWPENLKEDFCLECYNCNCSKNIRKEKEQPKDLNTK